MAKVIKPRIPTTSIDRPTASKLEQSVRIREQIDLFLKNGGRIERLPDNAHRIQDGRREGRQARAGGPRRSSALPELGEDELPWLGGE